MVEVDADIRTGWTWWEILRNIPADNLAAYQQAVFDNPVPTKACTSGVAYTLGDFTCQLSQGKTIATVDLRRSFRSGVAGFSHPRPAVPLLAPVDGGEPLVRRRVVGHVREGVRGPDRVESVPEQRVHHVHHEPPGYGSRAGDGRDSGDVVERHQRGLEVLAVRARAHLLPIIPQDFKLLWVDCVEVIWVTILSAAVNRDAEKALQVPLNAEAERPTAQLQDQLEEQFSAEVSGVSMSFDKELLPSRDSADGIGSGSFDDEDPAGCSWRDSCPRISGRRMETSPRAAPAAGGDGNRARGRVQGAMMNMLKHRTKYRFVPHPNNPRRTRACAAAARCIPTPRHATRACSSTASRPNRFDVFVCSSRRA